MHALENFWNFCAQHYYIIHWTCLRLFHHYAKHSMLSWRLHPIYWTPSWRSQVHILRWRGWSLSVGRGYHLLYISKFLCKKEKKNFSHWDMLKPSMLRCMHAYLGILWLILIGYYNLQDIICCFFLYSLNTCEI